MMNRNMMVPPAEGWGNHHIFIHFTMIESFNNDS